MLGLPPRQLLKLLGVIGLTVGLGLFGLYIGLLGVSERVERLGLFVLNVDLRTVDEPDEFQKPLLDRLDALVGVECLSLLGLDAALRLLDLALEPVLELDLFEPKTDISGLRPVDLCSVEEPGKFQKPLLDRLDALAGAE